MTREYAVSRDSSHRKVKRTKVWLPGMARGSVPPAILTDGGPGSYRMAVAGSEVLDVESS